MCTEGAKVFRLLGFTTGAALAIGAIVMVMGVPELSEPASATDAAIQPGDPAASPTPVAAPAEPVAAPADEFVDLPTPRASDAPASAVDAIAEIAPPTNASHDPADAIDPSGEPLWHSFWNPFRSEIAANGFAARLTAVTGIDYRVVRLEPGAYQVAFAYTDDGERAAKIAQIETATGLNLPEEAP